MSDFKVAAEQLRELADWKTRALAAEEKVAKYERKERVANIVKKAEAKSAQLPKNLDLMKCSEDELVNLDRCLDLITPRGDIKLGGLDEDSSVPTGNTKPRSALDEYLLAPHPEFNS